MLIQCPECGLQASDKALSCPHCGFPFQQNPKQSKIRKSNRRKRLPNGFGQITELKGRSLRKPFRAMVTVGKNENGRPICKLLQPEAYFKTYNEAYEALVKYNKNPYDIDNSMTMQMLYERWSIEHFKNLKSDSAKRAIIAVWQYCKVLQPLKISEVRAKHIKECIETGHVVRKSGKVKYASAYTKLRMKQVIGQVLDYAVEYDLTDRNYARIMNAPAGLQEEVDDNRKHHIAFTSEEMNILWRHEGERDVDMILVQCYSGWRPTEICTLTVANTHLDERYMTGGIKTKAGKKRYVPIHPRIYRLVAKYYNEAVSLGKKRVFNQIVDGEYKSISYEDYWSIFCDVMARLDLNPEHRPHDARKHFVTMAKAACLDEYAIKYIVGHEIKDITERVYTERNTAWLQSEMQKIR